MEQDPLSLVKFWTVGYDDENGISVIDNIYHPEECKIQIKNNNYHKNIRIVGYNIFGDRFTVKL